MAVNFNDKSNSVIAEFLNAFDHGCIPTLPTLNISDSYSTCGAVQYCKVQHPSRHIIGHFVDNHLTGAKMGFNPLNDRCVNWLHFVKQV